METPIKNSSLVVGAVLVIIGLAIGLFVANIMGDRAPVAVDDASSQTAAIINRVSTRVPPQQMPVIRQFNCPGGGSVWINVRMPDGSILEPDLKFFCSLKALDLNNQTIYSVDSQFDKDIVTTVDASTGTETKDIEYAAVLRQFNCPGGGSVWINVRMPDGSILEPDLKFYCALRAADPGDQTIYAVGLQNGVTEFTTASASAVTGEVTPEYAPLVKKFGCPGGGSVWINVRMPDGSILEPNLGFFCALRAGVTTPFSPLLQVETAVLKEVTQQ